MYELDVEINLDIIYYVMKMPSHICNLLNTQKAQKICLLMALGLCFDTGPRAPCTHFRVVTGCEYIYLNVTVGVSVSICRF